MSQITITEALAEINLIKKKILSKKDTIKQNLFMLEHIKDPYEADGGAKVAMTRELQAVNDLEKRLVSIRSQIAMANLKNTISVSGETKSIFDWLSWKREVLADKTKTLNDLTQTIQNRLAKLQSDPQVYKTEDGSVKFANFMPSLDLPTLRKDLEVLSDQTEKLDGQLSLKNATIVIDV